MQEKESQTYYIEKGIKMKIKYRDRKLYKHIEKVI